MPKVGQTPERIQLKTQQARVLAAVVGRGGCLPRALLNEAAGFTKASGSVTRALHGLREGSSSGAAHAGLIELGLARVDQLDLDGVKEEVVVVTDAGRAALAAFGDLPRPRDKASSVNVRYTGEG